MSTKPLSTVNLREGSAVPKENLPMHVNDAYELLGVTPDASKEEIKGAYLDLASNYLDKGKRLDDFLNLSDAFVSLSESNKSLMVYRPEPEASEAKNEPKVVSSVAGKLWEQKLSLASVLGLALMTGVGVFVGFSFQPKTMVIREIIREASAPSQLVTPSKKIAVSDTPAKASDKLTTNKAVKTEDTDALKPALVLQKGDSLSAAPAGQDGHPKNIAQPAGASRRFAGVLSPPIGPLVYVPPVGKVPPRGNIQSLPPVPGMPVSRLMSPVAIRNQVPNTAPMPLQVPQTREDKPDKNLPVVMAPPAPAQEIPEQIEPLTPKDRTLSAQHRISAVDVLSTIEIPLEGGETVKANILLEADRKIWKVKKGITRQKLSTLISALVESKDLTLSAQKAGLSLRDIQTLVKPPIQD